MVVERCGEDDEEQQREEESRAADKLEEIKSKAAHAAADHFLQDEGHKGQELEGKTGVTSSQSTPHTCILLDQRI